MAFSSNLFQLKNRPQVADIAPELHKLQVLRVFGPRENSAQGKYDPVFLPGLAEIRVGSFFGVLRYAGGWIIAA